MPLSSVIGSSSIMQPGVCTSSTRPASPYDGQVIYETDTDRAMVYNGTSWVVLSTGRANSLGLDLVKTQTVGTAVSSVTVSDVFSATYDNYKIVLSNIGSTVSNAPITLAMGSSTGATFKITSAYMTYGSASFNGYNVSGQTNFKIGWSDTTAAPVNLSLDLLLFCDFSFWLSSSMASNSRLSFTFFNFFCRN
jgi:hypothetical protein